MLHITITLAKNPTTARCGVGTSFTGAPARLPGHKHNSSIKLCTNNREGIAVTMILLTHEDCLQHAMHGHPEQPARLQVILQRIQASGMAGSLNTLRASAANTADLNLVHPSALYDELRANISEQGNTMLDPDTYAGPDSLHAARLAAGACLQAVDLVLGTSTPAGSAGSSDNIGNGSKRVFCAVRPPGHHAERAAAMGFCLFNNIALAAASALQHPSIERVAILDFDVHHCNGTVDIFKDVPEVLVCSSFQANYYPHRYLDFTNEHIISTPLTAGSGSETFRSAIERDWLPALAAHQPDLILVSAGFDAHANDPLAQLQLTTDDFRWITELIVEQANRYARGRIISTLEGGYNLEALADSVEQHLEVLMR